MFGGENDVRNLNVRKDDTQNSNVLLFFEFLSHYLKGKLHLTWLCFPHQCCVQGSVKAALVS